MTTHELADLLPRLRDKRTVTGLARTQVVVRKPELGPCWEYTGARDQKGYGQFWGEPAGGGAPQTLKCHREAARVAGIVAPQIRHRCDNPPCFNPAHLEGGDNSANQIDSVQRGRHKNAAKTHCPKGHPYADHIQTHASGKHRRRCYTCETASRPKPRGKGMRNF